MYNSNNVSNDLNTQIDQLDVEGYDEDYVPSGYHLGANPLDSNGNVLPLHKIFDLLGIYPNLFDLSTKEMEI